MCINANPNYKFHYLDSPNEQKKQLKLEQIINEQKIKPTEQFNGIKCKYCSRIFKNKAGCSNHQNNHCNLKPT
jgi:hypothetical protein